MTAVLEPKTDNAETAQAVARPSSWLQVMVDLHPRYGGMSAAVPELAEAVQAEQIAAPLAALCHPSERFTPARLPQASIHFFPRSHKAWLLGGAARAELDALVHNVHGVHVHGLWTPATIAAAGAARRMRRPYCVSAHGMLEPWSMQQHRLRKQVYVELIERPILQGAACLHALTVSEARSYRRIAGCVPVAIVPNGVTVPAGISDRFFFAQYPALQHKRIVLFLGRLHAKKGVDLLLKAWQSMARSCSNAHLVIAGPADSAMSAALQQLVQSSATHASVTFTGMLQYEMKWSALCAAEVFVLPSHSEGFSVAILEALGTGTPVLATPQCNMPQLITEACGWLTEPSVPALTLALQDALERSPAENRETGKRGSSLIDRDYTWRVVGRKMAEVYRWMEGGPIPTHAEVLL